MEEWHYPICINILEQYHFKETGAFQSVIEKDIVLVKEIN